ncbi:Gibberellin-regulated protein 2 [Quillaja saponaria]|uniref:Gibberellin-regulated protein 2 n=1 Tax=Quillaja saponaria TaxID=32244 RepID=A0AAD7L821_QUISA|nr:Gibberellin-regulated protein 2 [Quillaja saponaria]
MAFSKTTLTASILLSLFLLHLTQSHQTMGYNGAPSPLPQKIDCGEACEVRCKLSSRPRLCNRACGTCCAKCSCVPPGTSGNHGVCPCYASLTTHNQTRKCP